MPDDRITQTSVPGGSKPTSSEQSESIMSADAMGAAVAATQSAAINRAIRATGAIVQVGRDAFQKIVARQQAPLVVHATGGYGLFRTSYQYLTSYKGLTFFACLSAPLEFSADTEIVLAKRIEVPDY